jgi:GntR family transcriptional regulator/MocR family aminotransferase
VELFVDLRRDEGGPLRRGLEREIREAVRGGRLLPGTPLPSTRSLSAQLGVSRGVVVETYAQLVAEGYLSARQGAATVVAARAGAGAAHHPPPEPSRTPASAPVPRLNFRSGVPDLSAFPRAAWLAAGARTLRSLPDARLGYGDARGAIELREALAAYLGRARGVVADADRLLVSGGTRQALGLVWRVLRDTGARRVAVEDPGWAAQHETVLDAGLQPVPVGVDERGLRVDELATLDVDAVVLTPAHQFPTGAVLAPERRAALLGWARRRDAVVVEDDYDAEYRYDRDPVGALQGMAADRVVYAGSTSKTLAPALRLGWVVLPPGLAEAAARCATRADRGGPLLAALTLADLIARGDLDRHLRRTRRRYRSRRDALVAAVSAELDGARVEGIAAGLHAVVRLPAGADETATVRAAAERGIALEGLASFRRTAQTAQPALVLGYANLSEQEIARGIAEIAEAIR